MEMDYTTMEKRNAHHVLLLHFSGKFCDDQSCYSASFIEFSVTKQLIRVYKMYSVLAALNVEKLTHKESTWHWLMHVFKMRANLPKKKKRANSCPINTRWACLPAFFSLVHHHEHARKTGNSRKLPILFLRWHPVLISNIVVLLSHLFWEFHMRSTGQAADKDQVLTWRPMIL